MFNKQIPEKNIVIVEKLINISNEILNEKIDNSKPILIKQENQHGESLDLILIINQTALCIQIGINKEKQDIDKVLNINIDNMKNELSKFLGITLNSCEIVFFFEKEKQED